jgi:dihydrofolate reductase
MRKVIISMMMSLDGFFAGPNGEFDWPLADEQFEEYAVGMLNEVDTIIFGRITYQMMASYWPTAIASPGGTLESEGVKYAVPKEVSQVHKDVADKMNSLNKIVFTKTLSNVEWNNSSLSRDINAEEIMQMKHQPGKDIVILGSGSVISAFADLGLIDEYRIFVNPIILGEGKALFKDLTNKIKLKLIRTKTFSSGLVGLYYQQIKE